MSKEDERRPQRSTLEGVARIAREMCLREGMHAPMLIVEGSLKTVIGQLEELPDTHAARANLLRSVGFRLGHMEHIGQLEQVFFIFEGWMSAAEGGKLPHHRPSQDPHRTEVLLITQLALREKQSAVAGFEMVRNSKGRLVALRPLALAEKGESFESPLLDAFVAGLALGTRTSPN